MAHAPHEHLGRHRHDHGFAALILAGGYVEAGDTGRHVVEAGDVLIHRAYESHLDRFDGRGAEVLVLPIDANWEGPLHGHAHDLDAIVRAAERDPVEAARLLARTVVAKTRTATDWPDLLAGALRDDPSLSIASWADTVGLHPGSIGRGFSQVFALTPAAFRLTARTHHALDAITRTSAPLSTIAQDCGFADQAHMTRAIKRIADTTPAALKRGIAQ